MEGVPSEQAVALFRELNDEYRERPLVPAPPASGAAAYTEVAERRIATIRKHLDLTGKTVLELGTGRGYTAAALRSAAGAARAIGIDLREYPDWASHDPAHVEFIAGDLSSDELLEAESVDAVVSAVVFEHVTRPLRMLEELHRVLRPGGEAWLYFNLYRGPKASHRYRHVTFPWPHLLFDTVGAEDVISRATGANPFAWVNRMTAAHYLLAVAEVGFGVRTVQRHPIDLAKHLDFYIRFEEQLGRYPALDLETDFLTLVLEKLPEPTDRVPVLDYLARQRRFDALVSRRKAELAAAPPPAPPSRAPAPVPVPVATEAAAPGAPAGDGEAVAALTRELVERVANATATGVALDAARTRIAALEAELEIAEDRAEAALGRVSELAAARAAIADLQAEIELSEDVIRSLRGRLAQTHAGVT